MGDEESRWLVVGLGNPEAEYGGSRHNVGADAVRALADAHGATWSRNKRIRCEETQVRLGGRRAMLVVPSAYMNESGGPVQAAVSWFDVPVEQVVVVHDELDLDVGQLRVKRGGSHAGHNGLRDVERALGSREYLRVRIGIGRPPGRTAGRDHVLRRFPPKERELVDVVVREAADAVESLVTAGLQSTQNAFNG